MTSPVIERRLAEQAEAIAKAAAWATQLVGGRGSVSAVVVFGSYARGDFNKWSDIDVLVIDDCLPESGRARVDLLWADRPAPVQPVGWTGDELQTRRRRRDPIAVEADAVGVVVHGALPPFEDG